MAGHNPNGGLTMKNYRVLENGTEVWSGQAESEESAVEQAYDGIDIQELGAEILNAITVEED